MVKFDFESARQMYGLGKLVKKVTRSVKKNCKVTIGKAAIGCSVLDLNFTCIFKGGKFNPFFYAKKV